MKFRLKRSCWQFFLLALSILVLLGFGGTPSVSAAGIFIPAPNRVDMVYDQDRDILYITSGSQILRYSIGGQQFLSAFDLGGNLKGIDLSPDGNLLAVADYSYTGDQAWIYLIDLRTGASQKAAYSRGFMEGGTWSVAFGNDGKLLTAGTFLGSGWVALRKYDPATGEFTGLTTICQNTMLSASADGSIIAFAESNISDGRWGRYRVVDGNIVRRQWYTDGTSWFNFEIAANHNGTQYAIPTYGGAYIYDANYSHIATLGVYAGPQPIGVAYHPTSDIAYFAWADTQEVRAYETTHFTQVASYNFEYTFQHTGNWAYTQGRLKIARNGQLLFATVGGGVRYVTLNPLPLALAASLQTPQNTPLAITLQGQAAMGNPLTYSVATGPQHGTLMGTPPNLTYTPAPDYSGLDSFTFTVTEGLLSSYPAKIDIDVIENYQPPVASDATISTNQDTPVAVTLAATAFGDRPLTYHVLTGPQHGTLSGSAPNLTYSPAAGYFGTDSFTFNANDSVSDSNTATITINVVEVYQPPVANDQSVRTTRNKPVRISLSASASGNRTLTFHVLTLPQHGKLTGTAPDLKYIPATGYLGIDRFTFNVNDGRADSNVATVVIKVVVPNRPPVARNDLAFSRIGRPVDIDVLANDSDPDGDQLTIVSISQPRLGTVTILPDGRLHYQPIGGLPSADTFTYTISDGHGNTATGHVTVTMHTSG